MILDLEKTYKVVCLKESFVNELSELEQTKSLILGKGTLNKKSLKIFFFTTAFTVSLILLSLNYFLHGMKFRTLLFYPLHLTVATMFVLVLVLISFLYNQTMKKINLIKNKNSRDYLRYIQNKQATESNINTVVKALSKGSTIPKKYRKKDVLEKLIRYRSEGRALNDGYAMYLFDKEQTEI